VIYKINCKGLIIYGEKLNAYDLININRRKSENSTKLLQYQLLYMAVNAGP
jgi:hypothetical protein